MAEQEFDKEVQQEDVDIEGVQSVCGDWLLVLATDS